MIQVKVSSEQPSVKVAFPNISAAVAVDMTREPTWDGNAQHPLKDWEFRQVLNIPAAKFASTLTDFREFLNEDNPELDAAHLFANAKADGSDIAFSIDGENQIDRYLYDYRPEDEKFEAAFIRPTASSSTTNYLYIYYGNPDANITSAITMPSKWKSDFKVRGALDLVGRETYKDTGTVLADNSISADYYNGKTYVAYVAKDLRLYARSYTHATETWSAATLVASTSTYFATENGHCVPELRVIRGGAQAGKILIMWANSKTKIFSSRSTNTEDISAWPGTPTTVDTLTGGELNRPVMAALSDGTILAFTDARPSGSSYYQDTMGYKSTDGGTSWSELGTSGVILHYTGNEYAQHAVYVGANDRVHIAVEYQASQSPFHCGTYYMKTDDAGTTFAKRDGTTIVAGSAQGSLDQIIDGGGTTINRCAAVMEDGSGNPVFMVTNSNGVDTSTMVEYSWSGSAWTSTNIASTSVLVAPRQSCGGCYGVNSSTAYVATTSALKKYTKSAGVWSLDSTIISRATGEIFRPNRVLNGTSAFDAVCCYSSDFTNGTLGWGIGQIFAVPLQKNQYLTINGWKEDATLDDRSTITHLSNSAFNMAGAAFTLKMRVKRANSVTAQEYLLTRRDQTIDTGSGFVTTFENPGTIRMNVVSSSGNRCDKRTTANYDDGAWHYVTFHIGATAGASKIRIDGADPSLTDNSVGTFAGLLDAARDVIFGKGTAVTSGWFTGEVDLVSWVLGNESNAWVDAEYLNQDMQNWFTVPAGVEERS